MNRKQRGLLRRVAAVGLLCLGITAAQAQPIGNGWLLGAEDDAERFRLLQGDAAGFSRAMWEVGYRYERLHQAILDGNYELALHDWGGI